MAFPTVVPSYTRGEHDFIKLYSALRKRASISKMIFPALLSSRRILKIVLIKWFSPYCDPGMLINGGMDSAICQEA
jgi:hypothetical protein